MAERQVGCFQSSLTSILSSVGSEAAMHGYCALGAKIGTPDCHFCTMPLPYFALGENCIEKCLKAQQTPLGGKLPCCSTNQRHSPIQLKAQSSPITTGKTLSVAKHMSSARTAFWVSNRSRDSSREEERVGRRCEPSSLPPVCIQGLRLSDLTVQGLIPPPPDRNCV